MRLYFSHPTFTFKTKTEKECMRIIQEHLEPDEIINPSDYGVKHDLRSKLKECDGLVAMAVSGVFTYVVWKEIEMVEDSEGFRLYTFMVQSKNDIGPLVKGVPEDIKRLSKKKSKELSHKIAKSDYQDGLLTSIVGSHRSRF